MDIECAVSTANVLMTATERDSVINSIGTIAGTPYASAPFMRSMGIKNYPPESNSEIAKNQYATEVITQCGRWENRAEVAEVRFEENNSVMVVIKGG